MFYPVLMIAFKTEITILKTVAYWYFNLVFNSFVKYNIFLQTLYEYIFT